MTARNSDRSDNDRDDMRNNHHPNTEGGDAHLSRRCKGQRASGGDCDWTLHGKISGGECVL